MNPPINTEINCDIGRLDSVDHTGERLPIIIPNFQPPDVNVPGNSIRGGHLFPLSAVSYLYIQHVVPIEFESVQQSRYIL